MQTLNQFRIEQLFELNIFGWFEHYLKFCDTDTFQAIRTNMAKYISNYENSEGIDADVIISYLNDGADNLISDFERKIAKNYSQTLIKKVNDVFVPLYIKTYNDIMKSKDVFFYLMFSKYKVSFEKDEYIITEKFPENEFYAKNVDDLFWLYDIEEFEFDLYNCIIQDDWAESKLSDKFVRHSYKHSYFIEDLYTILQLKKMLFIEELKKFD